MRYVLKKLAVLLLGFLLSVNSFAADINVETPVTLSTINSAITTATPGDTVIIPNGTYTSLGQINISVNGTDGNRIVLKAETPGGVTFDGNVTYIYVTGNYITIRDFIFDGLTDSSETNTKVIFFDNADYLLITNNYFVDINVNDKNDCAEAIRTTGTTGTTGLEISYNTFQTMWAMAATISKYDSNFTIKYNYHKDFHRGSVNSLTLGYHLGYDSSEDTLINGTIEYNLFDNFTQDVGIGTDIEAFDVKCGGNTFRYNVFKNGKAGINLRGGYNNTIESNYFFDIGSGVADKTDAAIVIRGQNQVIKNNYIEGTSLNYAILVAAGDKLEKEDEGNYIAAGNIEIYNNTILDSTTYGIAIGLTGGDTVQPYNLTFKNNIVSQSLSTLIIDDGHTGTFVWANNLHYNQGTATYWLNNDPGEGSVSEPAGITHNDPNLTTGYDIYRLQATSTNAIEEGTPVSGITDDIDGHTRDETNPDIGCDEYSASAPARLPITEDEVGVSWLQSETPAEAIMGYHKNGVVGTYHKNGIAIK